MRADVSIDNAVRVATEMGWMYHNRMGERMERDKGKGRREKGRGGEKKPSSEWFQVMEEKNSKMEKEDLAPD